MFEVNEKNNAVTKTEHYDGATLKDVYGAAYRPEGNKARYIETRVYLQQVRDEKHRVDLIQKRIQYRKENDRLRQAAHAASREVKESQQNIEKLEQEAEEHTQELADLRELVFNQQNGEYEKDTPDTMGRKKSAPP